MTDPTSRADVLVVGNGMFGSAAIRHLAERGHAVIGIGAASSGPDVRVDTEPDWPSHRVYASHNDAARLTRRQDRDADWAELTERAIAGYRELEARSGISFCHDVGCLVVSRVGGDGVSADPRVIMQEMGIEHTFYAPGDDAWRQRWPEISFPNSHYVAFEPAPAGYIQPKSLIAAQNVLAEQAGAELVTDTVINVEQHGSHFRVATAAGASFEADKVLVAAGAFANFNHLLPKPAEVTLKSEVIVLGEVSQADAQALARFPTVKYLLDPGDLEAIYMVPPIRYEDGRYYIKAGANTRLDTWMTELDVIQRWFNTDTDADYLPLYEPTMRAMWPGINFVSMRTQPCLITYTANRFPLIDHVGHGLFIATAGNGGGAKGSDAWGERAAELVAGTAIA